MSIDVHDYTDSMLLTPGNVLRYTVGRNGDYIFVVCMAHDEEKGARPVEIALSKEFAMRLASDIVNEFHVHG